MVYVLFIAFVFVLVNFVMMILQRNLEE